MARASRAGATHVGERRLERGRRRLGAAREHARAIPAQDASARTGRRRSPASSGAMPAATRRVARGRDVAEGAASHASTWRDLLQLLGVVERRDLIEQLGHVAFEHGVQLVGREVDAVVGDAALREVVGADLLGPLAGAHLAAPLLGDGVLLLLHLHLVETRAQHLHRLRAVLDLRLLVLLRHDDAGRNVREPHRRVGGVHALAAGAARAERVDAQVLLVDLDVHVLGFGQHRHRGRGRVDAAAGLGGRHALHAVHAALVLQPAVDAACLRSMAITSFSPPAGLSLDDSTSSFQRCARRSACTSGRARRRRAPPRRRRCRRGSRG